MSLVVWDFFHQRCQWTSDLRFHRLDFDDSGGASCTPGATWCQCCTGEIGGSSMLESHNKGHVFQIWKIFLLYSFSGVPITRLTLCLATAVGDNLPVTDNLSTWNLDVQLIFTGFSCFFGDNNLWVKSRFFFDIRLRFFQFEVPSF